MRLPHSAPRGLSKLIILSLFGVIFLIIGVVLYTILSSDTPAPKNVTLTIWGVWDDSADLQPLIAAYRAQHPYISIRYTKLRPEEFREKLITAWATDTGPDIYALPSAQVGEYRENFIAVAPKRTTVAYYSKKKVLFKTETEITNATEPFYTAADIRGKFIDTVYGDIVHNGSIYAMPIGINTLVMFYNRDLLNQASLVQPPASWSEFAAAVSRLAVTDEQNQIVRAAAALGTHGNIPAATDILSLLMIQNGATMTSGERVTFAQASSADPTFVPAQEALRFYTDFASPTKTVYTWNDTMPNALDMFAEGNLAFYFDFRFRQSEINGKARGLDYDVAPVPQVDPRSSANIADYWVYTVAKKSKHPNEAWNFLHSINASSKLAKARTTYLQKTNQMSALRSALQTQLNDPATAVFAQQALTATSWYHGKSSDDADAAFGAMIDAVNDGDTLAAAVASAAKRIQQGY